MFYELPDCHVRTMLTNMIDHVLEPEDHVHGQLRWSNIMTVNVDVVKCACANCVCVVSTNGAIEADGRKFCGDACAQHHASGNGCDHAGCTCHG